MIFCSHVVYNFNIHLVPVNSDLLASCIVMLKFDYYTLISCVI